MDPENRGVNSCESRGWAFSTLTPPQRGRHTQPKNRLFQEFAWQSRHGCCGHWLRCAVECRRGGPCRRRRVCVNADEHDQFPFGSKGPRVLHTPCKSWKCKNHLFSIHFHDYLQGVYPYQIMWRMSYSSRRCGCVRLLVHENALNHEQTTLEARTMMNIGTRLERSGLGGDKKPTLLND